MRAVVVGIVAGWVLFTASGLAAQDQALPADEAEARRLFMAGRASFDGGRFDEALEYFRAAHSRSGRPELLYNVGISAQRLGRDAEAIDAFEAYVAALPEAPNRAEVETHLRILRRTAPPPPPPTPAPEPDSEGPGAGPWVVLGAGIVMAAGGAVLLAIGEADRNEVADAEMGTAWSDLQGAADRGPVLSTLGVIGVALGVTAAAVGVVWLGTF